MAVSFSRKKNGKSTNEVLAIVEQKSLKSGQEKIPEINVGIYAFAVKPLFANIHKPRHRQCSRRVLPYRHG